MGGREGGMGGLGIEGWRGGLGLLMDGWGRTERGWMEGRVGYDGMGVREREGMPGKCVDLLSPAQLTSQKGERDAHSDGPKVSLNLERERRSRIAYLIRSHSSFLSSSLSLSFVLVPSLFTLIHPGLGQCFSMGCC